MVKHTKFKEEEITKLTKYEKARIIGSRALQIAQGAKFMAKLSEEELKKIGYNPVEIAKLELEQGVIPITVKRPMPKVNE
jgi:DNA-directed RNA polymerase subunit K